MINENFVRKDIDSKDVEFFEYVDLTGKFVIVRRSNSLYIGVVTRSVQDLVLGKLAVHTILFLKGSMYGMNDTDPGNHFTHNEVLFVSDDIDSLLDKYRDLQEKFYSRLYTGKYMIAEKGENIYFGKVRQTIIENFKEPYDDIFICYKIETLLPDNPQGYNNLSIIEIRYDDWRFIFNTEKEILNAMNGNNEYYNHYLKNYKEANERKKT